MSNGVRIDTEAAMAKAREISSVVLALRANINNLKNNVNSLNGVWESEASDIFVGGCNDQITILYSLANQLEKFGESIYNAAVMHRNADDESADAARKI